MPPLFHYYKQNSEHAMKIPTPEYCLAEEVHDLRVGHAQREVAIGFAPAGITIGRITAQRQLLVAICNGSGYLRCSLGRDYYVGVPIGRAREVGRGPVACIKIM